MKTIQVPVRFVISALALVLSWGSTTQAQLTDYTWNVLGGGTVNWQTNSWTQTGDVHASQYPNSAFHGANLSVGLNNSLTVNVNGVDPNNPGFVTVGPIRMGGTSGAVTTNIGSVNNGYLLFQNDDDADFNDNRFVDGLDFLQWQRGFDTFGGNPPSAEITNGDGDADADLDVDNDDLDRWAELYGSSTKVGTALITSVGVAGSTNLISAPIHLSAETLAMSAASTNDLTLSGEIRPTGGLAFGADTAEERGQVSRIRNFSNKTLFITGLVNTIDPANGTTDRRLLLNDSDSSHGTIHFTSSSTIVGGGISADTTNISGLQIVMGSRGTGDDVHPLPTVILSGANTFTGKFELNRGNLVLDNNNALGDPNESKLDIGGPTGQLGFNIRSTSDARNIPVNMKVAQPFTVKGTNSLTWSGNLEQSNDRRGIISMLPAPKFFEVSGRTSAFQGDAGVDQLREFRFDGKGETRITGGYHDDDIHNNGIIGDGYDPNEDADDDGTTGHGSLVKRGSGVLKVSGKTSTFTGTVRVEMGNLHFDRFAHLTAMSGSGFGGMISTGGAVGLDTSSLDPAFIALFSNTGASLDTGGLMLAPGDSATNLIFAGGGATLANARLMTVAAPEGGMTYTGTITPFGNVVRLGGGSGKLSLSGTTLDNATRSLYVANGGEVHITGTTTMASTSGTVEVTGSYVSTFQEQAELDDAGLAPERIYLGTTLTASVLANGGSNSSIGRGASTADRIMIRGSTLKYVGAANATTNRLFTIGTAGATIDASGASGTVDFNSAGTLGTEVAADRLASNDSFAAGSAVLTGIPSTANLVIGMTVTGITGGSNVLGTPTIPPDTTIADVLSPTSVLLSDPLPVGSYVENGTISFSNFSRTLTLTGSNTGDNFMRPIIANATQGPVGLTKQGAGKWIVTNANTYSGPTTVEAGTLLINGNQSGGSAYSVDPNSTLGGTGTLGGVGASLTNDGRVAPGSAGVGALTVGGAYTQSSGGSLRMEMSSGASFDTLVVNGAASLAGTINVDLLGIFVPAASQTFDILTATGGVTNNGLSVTGDGNWTVSVVGGNTLRLTFNSLMQAVPEPGTLALLSIGLLLAGRRRRG